MLSELIGEFNDAVVGAMITAALERGVHPRMVRELFLTNLFPSGDGFDFISYGDGKTVLAHFPRNAMGEIAGGIPKDPKIHQGLVALKKLKNHSAFIPWGNSPHAGGFTCITGTAELEIQWYAQSRFGSCQTEEFCILIVHLDGTVKLDWRSEGKSHPRTEEMLRAVGISLVSDSRPTNGRELVDEYRRSVIEKYMV